MTEEKVCCPEFNIEPWDEKEIVYQDKMFIKDSFCQILHIPLPGAFGITVSNMWKKIEAAGAKAADKDFVMLSKDPSPWQADLYISVAKKVSDANNVKISGKFLTKVFDGPYNHIPKWIKIMDEYVASKGKAVKDYYFYYTTCPKCAKKYGHNYVVILAQVD